MYSTPVAYTGQDWWVGGQVVVDTEKLKSTKIPLSKKCVLILANCSNALVLL